MGEPARQPNQGCARGALRIAVSHPGPGHAPAAGSRCHGAGDALHRSQGCGVTQAMRERSRPQDQAEIIARCERLLAHATSLLRLPVYPWLPPSPPPDLTAGHPGFGPGMRSP